MSHIIVSVDPKSPAQKAGIRPGDALTHIGSEAIVDFLDYQALSADRKISVRVLRDGKPVEFSIAKGEYESLGLNFETPMMSAMRNCCNNCVFCFVDQLPEHVRDTMKVKDDDWRMSLMTGSYVTLTNVGDKELERIIARHASPLYISVHATDPELRTEMIRTPRAGKLMEQLRRLSDGGIEFHCQAVLCPGMNDGAALERTISDLVELEGALSLALVPVGLTNHREGLCELRKYNADEAKAVIELANRWRERLLEEKGTRFVFPSDEFYLQAGMEVPSDEEYEDYGQIDDGVGLLRLLHTEYVEAWEELPEEDRQFTGGRKVAIACGVSAAEFLTKLIKEHPVAGVDVAVYPVENKFFGSNVTVSGLVTGNDLVERMASVDCECVLITECMLRNEGDRFLDDVGLDEACERLGKPVVPVGRRGDELLDALLERRNTGNTEVFRI